MPERTSDEEDEQRILNFFEEFGDLLYRTIRYAEDSSDKINKARAIWRAFGRDLILFAKED